MADHATLVLNNAMLTVTEVAGETLWDTPYRLFEVDPDGAVAGRFGTVQAINPDATAVYYIQGTANAADDRVALTYDPQTSEAALHWLCGFTCKDVHVAPLAYDGEYSPDARRHSLWLRFGWQF